MSLQIESLRDARVIRSNLLITMTASNDTGIKNTGCRVFEVGARNDRCYTCDKRQSFFPVRDTDDFNCPDKDTSNIISQVERSDVEIGIFKGFSKGFRSLLRFESDERFKVVFGQRIWWKRSNDLPMTLLGTLRKGKVSLTRELRTI